MTYPGLKRAIRARSGRGGRGNNGGISTITDPISDRDYKMTNGSVINWGGNDKMGLFPTVGVSMGFLNIISSCCSSTGGNRGVNLSQDANKFLM